MEGVVTGSRYDPAERAYQAVVNRADPPTAIRLRLDCSPDHPAVNPAIVVSGWGERPVAVLVNGRRAEPLKDFRAGFRKTIDGTDLVLWLERTSTAPLEVRMLVHGEGKPRK